MVRILILFAAGILLSACGNEPGSGKKTSSQSVTHLKTIRTRYKALTSKDSIKNIARFFTPGQQDILQVVNRIDADHILRLDTVLLPLDISGDPVQYSPFPQSASFLKEVKKIVFFSYPAEYFAAYENGSLVYSGPTNMGRQKDPTPTGLFYTNWKAEETKSTFNDEWELKWNFNIENKLGVGWHQYEMPGYPSSHACLRMRESDAKKMYDWAEQWVVKNDTAVQVKGTPVIVFGSYPFGGPKPWLQLLNDPHALDLSEDQLQQQTQPHLNEILNEQKKRIASGSHNHNQ